MSKEINWEKEQEKCKASPFYFATNYLRVEGKPFTTPLTEKEFNEQVKLLEYEQKYRTKTKL